jgi:NAD(P)-dependent dehydrogenase (short-subunit alcohol dehydrogenase family)
MAGHQERAPLVCLISGVKTELGRTIAYTFAEEGGQVILVGETEDREELGRVRTWL